MRNMYDTNAQLCSCISEYNCVAATNVCTTCLSYAAVRAHVALNVQSLYYNDDPLLTWRHYAFVVGCRSLTKVEC
jgi:hypothetical protein